MDDLNKIVILGAGLSGLSCSYHLGHDKCIIYEKNDYLSGHANSYEEDGFTWDEGPHISFTKSEYVRELFEKSTEVFEFNVKPGNYFRGNFINHPAQNHLYQVPEELRSEILNDFIKTREEPKTTFNNYEEWCNYAFGKIFTNNFVKPYTKKYWRVDANELDTDWIGQRIYYPKFEDVVNGAVKSPESSNNYIQNVRYPKRNGFSSFTNLIQEGANIEKNKRVINIDLKNKLITFSDGSKINFKLLISTIPLNQFIQISNPMAKVSKASQLLQCTSLKVINITGEYNKNRDYSWIYVYDIEKLSTRVSFIEKLSKNNVKKNKTGMQVEVYNLPDENLNISDEEIKNIVTGEVKEMSLINKVDTIHLKNIKYANIVCDLNRKKNLDIILEWLTNFGLKREYDDLSPTTNWDKNSSYEFGNIILAGRFGQWKYFWSDDCILRGKQIADCIGAKQ